METNRGRLTVCDSMNNLSVNEKDDITCGCGKPRLFPTGFFDFTDRSVVNYECVSCGNIISATIMRTGKDKKRWEDN